MARGQTDNIICTYAIYLYTTMMFDYGKSKIQVRYLYIHTYYEELQEPILHFPSSKTDICKESAYLCNNGNVEQNDMTVTRHIARVNPQRAIASAPAPAQLPSRPQLCPPLPL